MPLREFQITIAGDGEVEVHIQGYKGKAGCTSAAAMFERVVGAIKATRETSEYYEPEETVHRQIEQGH